MSEDGDITLVKGHKRGHKGVGGGGGRFGEGGRCCTGITGRVGAVGVVVGGRGSALLTVSYLLVPGNGELFLFPTSKT